MKKSLLLLMAILLLLSGCGKPAASSETVYSVPEDSLPNVTSNNFYTSFSYRENANGVYSYPQENPPYIGWGKEYKGYIYCQDADTRKLYRYKPDGSELMLISEEITGDFYIVDDWIYYCGEPYSDFEHPTVYKVQLDGSNEQVFVEKIYWDSPFQLFNGYFYYINVEDDSLCRIKPDGTDLSKMKVKDIDNFTVTEDYIYYVSKRYDNEKFTGAICRMNHDGTGLKTLYNKFVYSIAITEKWIYFSDYDPENNYSPHEKLYIWRIPIGGGKAESVVKASCSGVFYQSGQILYHDYDDDFSTYTLDITTNESKKIIDDVTDGQEVQQQYYAGDWVWYVTYGIAGTKLNKIKLDGSENQQLNVPLMLPIETDYSYYFEADPYLGNWTFIKTLGQDPAAFGASVIGSGIVIDKKRYIEHTESCEAPTYNIQDSSMDELAQAGVPTAELQADKVVKLTVTSLDFESSVWVLDDTFIILPINENKTFCVAERTSDTPSNLNSVGRIFARYYKDSMMSIDTYFGNWAVSGAWGYGYTPKDGGRNLQNAYISLSKEVYIAGNQRIENPYYKISSVCRSSLHEGDNNTAYEMTMGFECPYVICVMVCASTQDAANEKYIDRFWVINYDEIILQGDQYYIAARE